MSCKCCASKLNSGMIYKKDADTGQKFKSCPHCSDAGDGEHVLHPYPNAFGKTSARITAKNPHGSQSYCVQCRKLEKGESSHAYNNGRICSTLA
jgi:hypothetical protein